MSTKKTYSEKLRDPRWQRKRLEIMERDNFACRHCFRNDKPLNVHHIRYINGNEPWEYENGVLITLCEECHEKEGIESTNAKKEFLSVLSSRNFTSSDYYDLTLILFETGGSTLNSKLTLLAFIAMNSTEKELVEFKKISSERNEIRLSEIIKSKKGGVCQTGS